MAEEDAEANTRTQLSKEEEADTTENEVTKEDQDKINGFSRLHNRSKLLEDELESKKVSPLNTVLKMRRCSGCKSHGSWRL